MEVWDLYFATLASWMLHPGYLRDGAEPPTLDEISSMVDKMMEVRKIKCPSP